MKQLFSFTFFFLFYNILFYNIDIHNVWFSLFLTKTACNSQQYRNICIETYLYYTFLTRYMSRSSTSPTQWICLTIKMQLNLFSEMFVRGSICSSLFCQCLFLYWNDTIDTSCEFSSFFLLLS